jgi:DNA-binding NtrC family response regulator
LKAFEDSAFDIAIVDIFLQWASGFELIGLMRERVPDLPVAAISGMATLDFVPASLRTLPQLRASPGDCCSVL